LPKLVTVPFDQQRVGVHSICCVGMPTVSRIETIAIWLTVERDSGLHIFLKAWPPRSPGNALLAAPQKLKSALASLWTVAR